MFIFQFEIILNFFFVLILVLYFNLIGRTVNRYLGFSPFFGKLKNLNLPLNLITGIYVLSLLATIFFFTFGLTNNYAIFIFTLISILGLFSLIESIKEKRLSEFDAEILRSFLFFLPVLFVYAIKLSLPEIGFDALAYHLANPAAERIVYQNDFNFYSEIPKGLDILFWFGHFIEKEFFLKKFFHFIFLLILSLLTFGMARIYITKSLAFLPVLLILLHPLSLEIAPSCYVDFGNASLEIGSLYFFFLFLKKRRIIFLSLSFSLLSFALSIKYTSLAVVLFVGPFALFLLLNRRYKYTRKDLNSFKIFIFFMILPLCFYLKNLYLLGNPLWPFYLGHTGMSDIEYINLTKFNLETYRFDSSFSSYLLLPIRVLTGNFQSYSIKEFHELITNAAFKDLELSILWISIIVIFSFKIRDKSFFAFLSLFVLFLFSFNFFLGSHQQRYILSVFLLLPILGSFLLNFKISMLSNLWMRNLSATLLILLPFFQMQQEIMDTFKYFRLDGKDKFLLKLHDYELNLMLREFHIPYNEVAFPFGLISFRYFDNYFQMKGTDTLGLGQTLEISKDLDILQKGGVKYWITNDMTTDWKKELLRRPYLDYKLFLQSLINLDEYIKNTGRVISRKGMNWLIEIQYK